MDWNAIGAVAEIVGAAGVIISLLFVAIQIRSNTQALRSTEYQYIHDTEDGFYSDTSSDPNLARIWKLGAGGISNVPDEDRPQWEIMAIRYIYLIQMVHYQRRKHMVDDEYWEAWDTAWVEMICTNVGIREIYELNESVCTQPFRFYTESCKARYKGGQASLLVGGRIQPESGQQSDA